MLTTYKHNFSRTECYFTTVNSFSKRLDPETEIMISIHYLTDVLITLMIRMQKSLNLVLQVFYRICYVSRGKTRSDITRACI